MARDRQNSRTRPDEHPPAPEHLDTTNPTGHDHDNIRPASGTTSSQRAAHSTATLPIRPSTPPPLSSPQCDAPLRADLKIPKELQSSLTSGFTEPKSRRRASVKQDAVASPQTTTPKSDKPRTPRSRAPSTPQERPEFRPPPALKKQTAKPEAPRMPTAPLNKRVKQLRISRNLIIGSEAFNLPPVGDPKRDPNIPEQHTKRWTIYVRQPEAGPDMRTWLSKVSFKIHPDYKPSLRIIENPPYEVTETGWGGFSVDVRLFFQPVTTEKAQYRTHFLQLEPYGDDAQKEKQVKEGLVRSEYLEVVEFNEPMDGFVDLLTSEAQFDYLKDVKQCVAQWGSHIVKGKKKAMPPSEGSAQLPVRGGEDAMFTQEQEDLLNRLIAEKAREVDKLFDEEMERKAKVTRRLQELRGEMGPEAAAQATKEASGDRVRRR